MIRAYEIVSLRYLHQMAYPRKPDGSEWTTAERVSDIRADYGAAVAMLQTAAGEAAARPTADDVSAAEAMLQGMQPGPGDASE